jgi:hypothetical protein
MPGNLFEAPKEGFVASPARVRYGQGMSRKHLTVLCLAGVFAVAVGCLFCGATLDTVLPHLLLDAVLTPEELETEAIRERTLAMLQKVKSAHNAYWFLTGGVLIALSFLGLWAALTDRPRS